MNHVIISTVLAWRQSRNRDRVGHKRRCTKPRRIPTSLTPALPRTIYGELLKQTSTWHRARSYSRRTNNRGPSTRVQTELALAFEALQSFQIDLRQWHVSSSTARIATLIHLRMSFNIRIAYQWRSSMVHQLCNWDRSSRGTAMQMTSHRRKPHACLRTTSYHRSILRGQFQKCSNKRRSPSREVRWLTLFMIRCLIWQRKVSTKIT